MDAVRHLADRTSRASTDLADVGARFRDRLEARARVQGLLSRLADVDRVTFEELLRSELVSTSDDMRRVTSSPPTR